MPGYVASEAKRGPAALPKPGEVPKECAGLATDKLSACKAQVTLAKVRRSELAARRALRGAVRHSDAVRKQYDK